MDLIFLVIWEWFKWIAIRLALFLALLTLGPSIGLIVFDILLYVFRTIVDNIPFIRTRQKQPPTPIKPDKVMEGEVKAKTQR